MKTSTTSPIKFSNSVKVNHVSTPLIVKNQNIDTSNVLSTLGSTNLQHPSVLKETYDENNSSKILPSKISSPKASPKQPTKLEVDHDLTNSSVQVENSSKIEVSPVRTSEDKLSISPHLELPEADSTIPNNLKTPASSITNPALADEKKPNEVHFALDSISSNSSSVKVPLKDENDSTSLFAFARLPNKEPISIGSKGRSSRTKSWFDMKTPNSTSYKGSRLSDKNQSATSEPLLGSIEHKSSSRNSDSTKVVQNSSARDEIGNFDTKSTDAKNSVHSVPSEDASASTVLFEKDRPVSPFIHAAKKSSLSERTPFDLHDMKLGKPTPVITREIESRVIDIEDSPTRQYTRPTIRNIQNKHKRFSHQRQIQNEIPTAPIPLDTPTKTNIFIPKQVQFQLYNNETMDNSPTKVKGSASTREIFNKYQESSPKLSSANLLHVSDKESKVIENTELVKSSRKLKSELAPFDTASNFKNSDPTSSPITKSKFRLAMSNEALTAKSPKTNKLSFSKSMTSRFQGLPLGVDSSTLPVSLNTETSKNQQELAVDRPAMSKLSLFDTKIEKADLRKDITEAPKTKTKSMFLSKDKRSERPRIIARVQPPLSTNDSLFSGIFSKSSRKRSSAEAFESNPLQESKLTEGHPATKQPFLGPSTGLTRRQIVKRNPILGSRSNDTRSILSSSQDQNNKNDNEKQLRQPNSGSAYSQSTIRKAISKMTTLGDSTKTTIDRTKSSVISSRKLNPLSTKSSNMTIPASLKPNSGVPKLGIDSKNTLHNTPPHSKSAKTGPSITPIRQHVLPEIETDSEDDSVLLDWARSPELRNILMQQQSVNPDTVFGAMPALNPEEVFKFTTTNRLAKFKIKSPSTEWLAKDKLSEKEVESYDKEMGYK